MFTSAFAPPGGGRNESFSKAISRARWPGETIPGAGLLRRVREHGPFFSEEELDRIERLKAEDRPPEDKARPPGPHSPAAPLAGTRFYNVSHPPS